MRKRSWTLGRKLEITALIYVASLLCNVGLSTLFIVAFLKPALNDAARALQCQRQIERIRTLVRQQRPFAEGDIASPVVAARYLELESEISGIATSLGANMSATELRSLWGQVSTALEQKKTTVDVRRAALATGDGSQPLPSIDTRSFVDLDRLLSEVITLLGVRRQASMVRATEVGWWVVGILLTNTVVGVAICIAGLWFVRKWVVLPTSELRRGTGRLSQGDFSARVAIQSADEMGDLGREVNQMAARIAEMQSQLVERERRSAAGEMVVNLEENLSGRLGEIRDLASTTCDGNENKDEVADFQRRIGSTTESLGNWLRDLRRIVEPSDPQLQRVPVEEMVRSVSTVLQPILDQSQVQVRTNLDPRIGEVQVDRLQFEQALIVLVTNAVEASKAGQTVQVAVAATEGKPDHWQLTVTDQGTGIPAELQERIFLPFFTTKPHGNGIGLGLVKAVIESHGGTLSLHSIPGSGTRFCVVLPRGRSQQ
jgi:signal transduction histidine kinase